MHPNIIKFSVIFIVIAGVLFCIFFTANEYQNYPDIYLEKKLATLKNSVAPEPQKFYDEYDAACYAFKNEKYELAYQHFYNVYHKYPTVAKGQLHLNAQLYMIKINQILDDRAKNGIEDRTRVKKYYESK